MSNERIEMLAPSVNVGHETGRRIGRPPTRPEGAANASDWASTAECLSEGAAAGFGRRPLLDAWDQYAIRENVLPSTNWASELFQTLTRNEPGSSSVALVTALLAAPDATEIPIRASLSAKVTVYCPTASRWIVTASAALLAQSNPGTEFDSSGLMLPVLTVSAPLSHPVLHSPGAAPANLAAFMALAALGATASVASFGVVTAPSASLSLVTAPLRMFFALTLL